MIELLVGMAVFVVVLSIVVGTFVRGLRLQRNTVSLITVNDSISLALEQIARELRTGSDYSTSPTETACIISFLIECTASGTLLEYTTSAGIRVRYELNSQTGVIERSTWDGVQFVNPSPFTSEDVIITILSFALKYFLVSDVQQAPRVTVSIVGKSADADPFLGQVLVRLQTTISRRF